MTRVSKTGDQVSKSRTDPAGRRGRSLDNFTRPTCPPQEGRNVAGTLRVPFAARLSK